MREARGYFIADPGGQSVLGIKYRDLLYCGYAKNGAETVEIVFVLASLEATNYDYSKEPSEIPDSSLIMSDNGIREEFNPTLAALYLGNIKAAFSLARPYHAEMIQSMLDEGTLPEIIAEQFGVFLSRLFLGRMANEVISDHPDWVFTIENEGKIIETFQRCSLEDYGD